MELPLFLMIRNVAWNLTEIRAIIIGGQPNSSKLWLMHSHEGDLYQAIDDTDLGVLLAELRSRGAMVETTRT